MAVLCIHIFIRHGRPFVFILHVFNPALNHFRPQNNNSFDNFPRIIRMKFYGRQHMYSRNDSKMRRNRSYSITPLSRSLWKFRCQLLTLIFLISMYLCMREGLEIIIKHHFPSYTESKELQMQWYLLQYFHNATFSRLFFAFGSYSANDVSIRKTFSQFIYLCALISWYSIESTLTLIAINMEKTSLVPDIRLKFN